MNRTPLIRAATVAAAATLATGVGLTVAHQANAAAGCRVAYTVNQWSTGFTGNVTVTNLGDPITGGWHLNWAFAGNQRITQGWSATITQSGQNVTATNPSWSASLGTNASANFGFNADYSGTNATPASFSLNGTVCTGGTTNPTPDPTTPTPTEPTPS